MSVRTRILFTVASVAVALLIAAEGVRWYASTQLAGGLAKVYGGRVEADRASAGWWQSTLQGVRLYEEDGEHVVVEIQQLRLGLTLWDLFLGRETPQHMSLEGPRAKLRFDRDAALLTRLPPAQTSKGTLPRQIDIQQAAVEIEQPGRKTIAIAGTNGRITSSGDQLNLAMTVDDQTWRQWKIDGDIDASFHEGAIHATAKQVPITGELLRKLPLAPVDLTEQISVDGPVDVDVRLRLPAENLTNSVQAELATRQAGITLPALGLKIEDATADVTLKKGIAALKDVTGSLAGGSLEASGELDLVARPLKLNLKVAAREMDISRFPAGRSLPEDTSGKISGQATLQFGLTEQGAIHVFGKGHAKVNDAVVAGVAVEPIEIKLQGGEDLPQGDRASGELSFHLRVRDAPLAGMLARLQKFTNAPPPDELDGAVTTDLNVAIPLATINDMATYRVSGKLEPSQARWRTLAAEKVQASINYSSGKLELDGLSAQLLAEKEAAGKLQGSLKVRLTPRGDVSTALTIEGLPLAAIARLAEADQIPQGRAQLNVAAAAPLDHVAEAAAWHGLGKLDIPDIEFNGRSAHGVSANFRIAEGTAHFTELQATAFNTPVTASAAVVLREPYDFSVKFMVPPVNLRPLLEEMQVALSEPVAAQVSASGRLSGSLRPFAWQGMGQAKATDLQVRQWSIEQTQFDWAVDPERISLKQIEANLLGGRVKAKATIPLVKDSPLKVSGDVEELQLDQIFSKLSELPVQAHGIVNGSFSLSGERPEDLTGEVRLDSERATVRGIDASALKLRGSMAHGSVAYEASSDLLDGQFKAKGELDLGHDPVRDLRGKGHVSLHHIPLEVVADLINTSRPPVSGELGFDLDYIHETLSQSPSGHGRLVLSDVRWDRRELVRRVESDVLLADNELRLPGIEAQLGSGELTASVSLPLKKHAKGDFRMSLSHVPADKLLALWPDLEKEIQGTFDAQLRGTLGSPIVGGGAVAASQAKVAGIDVSGMRLPLQFLYSPASGRGEIKIAESTVQAAHGKIRGGANIVYDRALAISGKVQLTDLRLSSLAHGSGSLGSISSGGISGLIEFGSSNFRSLDDLNASYNLTFAQAQASQFPVLSDLSRYILPTVPSATSFQKGKLVGRLAGGVARIQRFALTGDDTRLLADGTITVQGRLDLNIVASTGGDPLSRGVIRRVALPIIEAQTVPLALLTRANAVMADQLVYLRVGGTIHSPSVQVRAAPQLEYEALRFFLTGATGGLQ
jgi:translocation and assembly module TamB